MNTHSPFDRRGFWRSQVSWATGGAIWQTEARRNASKNFILKAHADEFEIGRLGAQWITPLSPSQSRHSLTARPGWLRLCPELACVPNALQKGLLFQKLPPSVGVTGETTINFMPMQWGEEAGMIIGGKSRAAIGLRHDGCTNSIVFRLGCEMSLLCATESKVFKIRGMVGATGRGCFSLVEGADAAAMQVNFKLSTVGGTELGFYSIKRLQWATAGHAEFDYLRFAWWGP